MKKRASTRPNKVPSNRIDCDERVQSHAEPSAALRTHARVLDGKHMPSGYTTRRTGRRRGHHLGHGHCWIVQKAHQPDLARTVPYRADEHVRHSRPIPQRACKKDPPFSSRRSPKRPSVTSVMACSSQIIQAKRVRPRQAMQADPKCVNVVAWRGRVGEARRSEAKTSEPGWGELIAMSPHPASLRSATLPLQATRFTHFRLESTSKERGMTYQDLRMKEDRVTVRKWSECIGRKPPFHRSQLIDLTPKDV